MDNGTIALIFTAITCFAMLIEKIFGGGNKLANKFHDLEKQTTVEINALRESFHNKMSSIETNYRVSGEAVMSNIHSLREGLLQFRAQLAEDYMKSDNFDNATKELKRDFKDANKELKDDMKEGFDRVQKTLDDMASAIEAARKSRSSPSDHH